MLFHAPLLGFLRGHHARKVHADVESEERCAHECLADEKCRSFQWKPPVSAQGSESGSVCALKRVAGAAAGLSPCFVRMHLGVRTDAGLSRKLTS